MKVTYDKLKDTIKNALTASGVSEEKSEIMAKVHADSTLKGVNSHGLNRIPRLIDFIEKGLVDIDAEMELVKGFGSVENYDGNLAFGVINALKASDRAAELAKEHGIGMVTLRNTTHWMRGGAYSENIADKGMIGMCWTNTESLMPVWGSDQNSLGNNPIGIAIPSESGNICLDMAISLYSYGKLETTRLKGENLPYPGGFDKDGNLTDDPRLIEESQNLLPVGYWKGSGLGICLDTMAALLSNGLSTYDMDDRNAFNCTSCSQIFIAMNPEAFSTKEENEKTIAKMKERVKSAHPKNPGASPRYPGLGLHTRKEKGLSEGIEVDGEIFKKVERLGEM